MRIVMMGTGTFAEPTFAALLNSGETVTGLVTQPEKDGAKLRGTSRQTGQGMAAMAAAAGVPVAQPVSINTPEGLDQLRAFQPDLLVVAAYGQILKPAVFETPKLGAINVHASLLPKYRGAAPVAHAILQGESETGVTIIRIGSGLDAGAMLAKVVMPIRPDETAGELESRLAVAGAQLCLSVVQRIKAGETWGESQDPTQVTKAPKLTKEMGKLHWNRPAEHLVRQVRAMQPWPSAYTFLYRPGKPPERVIIAKLRNLGPIQGLPPTAGAVGSPFMIEPKRLIVPCYDGTSFVEVLELQLAGKSRMTAVEFLRGNPLPAGTFFAETTPAETPRPQ
jgi:methionyl-tRNA formyltransferase